MNSCHVDPMPETRDALLKLDNITFSYDEDGERPILKDFSTDFSPGKITIITGVSGCGKSTLLYIAAGIYPKNAGLLSSGSVFIGATDIQNAIPEERASLIGMMFQNPDLQFCMDTVENELIFCLENVLTPKCEIAERISEALSFCGIEHLRKRKLTELSGGEKQKAMLACINSLNPRWMLLDEPFANIDTSSAHEIADKLSILSKDRGIGIVVVDHKVDIWLSVADEIKVLEYEKGIVLSDIKPNSNDIVMLPDYGVDIPSRPYRIQPSTEERKAIAEPNIALEVKDLSVQIKNSPIITGINVSFEAARIHALIGSSGSGKTTFLEAITGFRKYKGNVSIFGDELKSLLKKNLSKNIGFVFQNPQDQLLTATVFDEIAIGLKQRSDIKNADEEIEKILREIGLWKYRLLSPYMLSQGEQRRLALAALLAYNGKILVCDEPTYAQDLLSLTAAMNNLCELVNGNGITLIFSTHDKKLARDYADKVYLMNDGEINEIDKSKL